MSLQGLPHSGLILKMSIVRSLKTSKCSEKNQLDFTTGVLMSKPSPAGFLERSTPKVAAAEQIYVLNSPLIKKSITWGTTEHGLWQSVTRVVLQCFSSTFQQQVRCVSVPPGWGWQSHIAKFCLFTAHTIVHQIWHICHHRITIQSQMPVVHSEFTWIRAHIHI